MSFDTLEHRLNVARWRVRKLHEQRVALEREIKSEVNQALGIASQNGFSLQAAPFFAGGDLSACLQKKEVH